MDARVERNLIMFPSLPFFIAVHSSVKVPPGRLSDHQLSG